MIFGPQPGEFPMDKTDSLRRILAQSKTIAVVGLSDNPQRPSYVVARYMQEHGYRIIPVNPGCREILGETCYPDLQSIPEKVDLVDVFRKAADTPEVAKAAVAIGAKTLWLQLGVSNDEARLIAQQGGLEVVMDRCLKIDHAHLFPGS